MMKPHGLLKAGRIAVLLICFLCVIVACRAKEQEKGEVNATVKKVAIADVSVLARVNNSPITKYELEQMMRRTVGNNATDQSNASFRQELLKSLVAARAIAMKAESELTQKEAAEIENRTRAFREELLVQKYLSRHVRPEPVSEQMIRAYYSAHPDEFGKKIHREYELITAPKQGDKDRENRFLTEMHKAGAHENWDQWAKSLSSRGFPVVYRRETADKNTLDKRLYQLIVSLDKGETSAPTFIEGRLYIIRITEINDVSPLPLAKVSEKIRKKLAPLQVKEAVKKASDQVLKTAKVVYTGGKESPEH